MKNQEVDYVIQMEDIDKHFPGVHALDHCRFELKKGEVHALIGENGAGKSTLVKIMTGIYNEYEGTYTYKGKPVHFEDIRQAQHAGISIVHQELNMMNDLTVAQNIFIGRESNGLFCSDKSINKQTQDIIDAYQIGVRPTDLLKTLSVGKTQMVEIARAMSYSNTQVLILDEPTAALSESEANELFERIADLKSQGVAIIFISHRLNEIMEIADRVTVMRDGAYIETLNVESCTVDDIIHLMVGRKIIDKPKQASNVEPGAPTVLEVKGLTTSKVKNVSFRLRKGEILGFAGLVGSGRTEVMRLICGADAMESGEVYIHQKKCDIRHTKDGIKYGIGYLSEDRKRYGLVLGLSVRENTVLPTYDKYSKKGFVNDKSCEEATYSYIDKLKIKTPSASQMVKNLSGGNQQKVVIAKWLLRDIDILIFDEPTRGIDVGARADIYNLMRELVKQGKSIIMVSSDLNEVLKMSDRVHIMCEGRITGELDISEANQEVIMTYATKHESEGN